MQQQISNPRTTMAIPVLHWLDTRPATATGVTWGICLPIGELPANAPLHLTRADGLPLATQT